MKSVSYETLAQSQLVQALLADLRIAVGVDLALVPPNKSVALEEFNPGSSCAGSSTTFECAAGGGICTMTQILLDAKDRNSGYQIECHAGQMHLAVPVMIVGRHVATLLAGNFSGRITRAGTECRMMSLLQNCGPEMVLQVPGRANCQTSPLTKEQIKAVGRVLGSYSRLLNEFVKAKLAEPHENVPDAVDKAQRYIKKHYAQDLTVEILARQLNVSVSHFEHLFKKSTGKSFTRYLAQVRIAKAEELLSGTKKSIKEIAYAVGFHSVQRFDYIFKNQYGQSPGEYRRMIEIAENVKRKAESDN